MKTLTRMHPTPPLTALFAALALVFAMVFSGPVHASDVDGLPAAHWAIDQFDGNDSSDDVAAVSPVLAAVTERAAGHLSNPTGAISTHPTATHIRAPPRPLFV